jgi:hypothetical protein
VAHIIVQDRRRNRPGMRPDLGLLSWPRAPPQPRHPAMRKVTPPVPHRADVHPQNCGDLLGLPPLQRQQSLPRRRPGIARARSASPRCSDFDKPCNAACSAASAVSFDFPGMPRLHNSHPRKTTHSIAHSQAGCLVGGDEGVERDLGVLARLGHPDLL